MKCECGCWECYTSQAIVDYHTAEHCSQEVCLPLTKTFPEHSQCRWSRESLRAERVMRIYTCNNQRSLNCVLFLNRSASYRNINLRDRNIIIGETQHERAINRHTLTITLCVTSQPPSGLFKADSLSCHEIWFTSLHRFYFI